MIAFLCGLFIGGSVSFFVVALFVVAREDFMPRMIERYEHIKIVHGSYSDYASGFRDCMNTVNNFMKEKK